MANSYSLQSGMLSPTNNGSTSTNHSSTNTNVNTNNSNTNGVAPMRMFIQRTRPYLSEQMISDLKPERVYTQARDQQTALVVFSWVWSISDVMGFPSRTRCTAMILYHRLRLFYNEIEYNLVDAACAALFTASKIEDTLKKSLEILAVAHNLRHANASTAVHPDPINSDSPLLEDQHKRVIGIERQILESCAFDFRNRHHEKFIPKLAKAYDLSLGIAGMAWLIAQDAYKTWTVLKMTPAELSLACLALAGRLLGHKIGSPMIHPTTSTPTSTSNDPSNTSFSSRNHINHHHHNNNHTSPSTGGNVGTGVDTTETTFDYPKWQTDFATILECIHDILDLYTDHLNNTLIGPKFGADAFIKVRIELNREAKAFGIPPNNNTIHVPPLPSPRTPGGYVNGNSNSHHTGTGGGGGVTNGEGGNNNNGNSSNNAGSELRGRSQGVVLSERSITGTVRFVLSRDREQTERAALESADSEGIIEMD